MTCKHGVKSAIKINDSDYKIICSNCDQIICISRDLDYIEFKRDVSLSDIMADNEFNDYKSDND